MEREVIQQEDFVQLLDKHALWMQSSGAEGEQLTLEGVDLRRCALKGKDLSGASLRGCVFDGLDMNSTILIGADLSGSKMSGIKGMAVNLTRANLQDVYAESAVFAGANLAQSKCDNAQFSNANFMSSSFREASLQGANFNFANLAGVDLRQANCTEAKFVRCNLQQTHFGQADCTDAFFMGAQFQGAILQGGCFTGATFHEMTFEGVDVSGVIGLPQVHQPMGVMVESKKEMVKENEEKQQVTVYANEATTTASNDKVVEHVAKSDSAEDDSAKGSDISHPTTAMTSLFFSTEQKIEDGGVSAPKIIPDNKTENNDAPLVQKNDEKPEETNVPRAAFSTKHQQDAAQTPSVNLDSEREKIAQEHIALQEAKEMMMQGVASAAQHRKIDIHLENKLLGTARKMRVLSIIWLIVLVLYALGMFLVAKEIPTQDLRIQEISAVGGSFAFLLLLCLLGARWSKKAATFITSYRLEKLNESTTSSR